MSRAWVGLGSNLDDPQAQLRRALAALDQLPGTGVLHASRLYRSPPWGLRAQPWFVNAVAELDTTLAPEVLLAHLQRLERAQGRRRDGPRWGPRTLDLDLLLYDGLRRDAAALTLPHPRLHERAFVLAPLAELAPDLEIPGRGRVDALLRAVDTAGCEPLV